MGSVDLFLKILTNFLKSWKQEVVLNSQHSSWTDILAGVRQGSVLGLLLFLICINNLFDGLQCNPKLFADDSSLLTTMRNINRATNDLDNDLKINHPPLNFNIVPVTQTNSKKYLRMKLDKKLNFEGHLSTVELKNRRKCSNPVHFPTPSLRN